MKVPLTCTEPPPAWTLKAWHLYWKHSSGSKRRTLSLPSTGWSWKIGLVTEDDMLPMGHCQVLSSVCPIQAAVIGSQQGLPCDHGTRVGGWWLSGQPSFHTNSSPAPSSARIYEEILSDHPQQSTVLTRCALPLSPRGLASHSKVTVAARLCRMRLMVARVRPMRPAIALCHMPSWASASTSCPIPRVGWGIISENWDKICNCWFE